DRQSATFDVFLLDGAGDPLLCMRGWTLRVAATAAAPLRQPTWEPQPVGPSTRGAGRWLLLPDSDGRLATAVTERLAALGHEVVELPADSPMVESRLADGNVSGVIHLAALDDSPAGADGDAALGTASLLVAPLLAAERSEGTPRSEPLRLVLATRGAQLSGHTATAGAPVGAAAL